MLGDHAQGNAQFVLLFIQFLAIFSIFLAIQLLRKCKMLILGSLLKRPENSENSDYGAGCKKSFCRSNRLLAIFSFF